MGKYSITKEGRFEASHILEGHSGKCSRCHGHSYRFRVTAEGDLLDSIGLLVDFSELPIKEIELAYDHRHLNNVAIDRKDRPADYVFPVELALESTSAESIAYAIFQFTKQHLCDFYADSVRVSKVTVWETAKCSATYEE